MSEFIVSARKYRPETFKSVIGQGGISKTLKNAINSKHLGHAYLFSGPRGVGKTTCARIFAKTINCENLTEETEPCNECESCSAFNESRSYNIHELDAASNNTVDGIRSLTEKVRIPPQVGRYSVYIIDEVHMLSLQAFNAFLKTLEEPPAHAVFILATTEKQKIIPTILSRCQIFDFNRIKVEDTVNYLKFISESESVKFEDEALHVIAQKADGAMRDALSIFDQVVSFSGGSVLYQDVIENLNILDYEYYFRATDFFLEGNVSEVLLLFDDILENGFDGHNFINGIASHLRDLLVSKDQVTIQLLEVSESLKSKYIEQSNKCSHEFLYEGLSICNQADVQYKNSRNQRLLIELALIKLGNVVAEKKNSASKIESPKRDNPEKPVQKIENNTTGSIENRKKPQPQSNIGSEAKKVPESTRGVHKRNVVSGSGISIKNALSGSSQNKSGKGDDNPSEKGDSPDDEEKAEKKKESFSVEKMNETWSSYTNKLKNDKPRLYSALISRKLVLKDDFTIEVSFENSSQMEDFSQRIKHTIQNYLRQELNNDYITVSSTLNEVENAGKKIYTAEDKFKYLVKKNPILGKLKQEFNLDFD